MQWKLLSLLSAAGLLFLAFMGRDGDKTAFEADREMIVMRQVAHKLLQFAGDSTSRVLPVNRVSDNEFHLSFESAFTFTPDSLVNIIHEIITVNRLPSDYIVQVVEPESEKVIFGYAILQSQQNNIVPCVGREQPVMKYGIVIRFSTDQDAPNRQSFYIAGTGLLLALSFSLIMQWKRKKKNITEPAVDDGFSRSETPTIGSFIFKPGELLLIIGNERIELTAKEARILQIFAASPNQIIDRSRLQKEVWEDEGVIVGRSLDVFVSRLRKKLEADPNVRLVNIHGKGYKLEVG